MTTSIMRHITKAILPLIQVFGLYVMIFGHISPGGGFAGGSILGASFILYRFVYGEESANKTLPYDYLLRLASTCLLTYGGIKGYVFLTAGAGLHGIDVPHGTPGAILSGGFILPLNILVGLVVAITFYFIAVLFEEGELEDGNLI